MKFLFFNKKTASQEENKEPMNRSAAEPERQDSVAGSDSTPATHMSTGSNALGVVELKLIQSSGSRCHKLVWSQDPHFVPEQLQDRITPEEWASTCELVKQFYHQERKDLRRNAAKRFRRQDRLSTTAVDTRKWQNGILAREYAKYKAVGVDISLIMVKHQGGEFPKGLRFEIESL